MQDIQISTKPGNEEKKELTKLNLAFLIDLLRKPFDGHFIHEFSQDPLKFLKMAFKLFGAGFYSNDKLEIIGERLGLPQNKDILEELMLATRSFYQMRQVSSVFKLDPFVVIKKDSEIETLWPTHVWQMESLYSNQKKQTTFSEKQRIFLEGLETIEKISTSKTSNIDLKSRIAFASCTFKDEHAYSEFLRSLKINELNLNCVDYTVKRSPSTLKEKLLKFGKIKTINKFEKGKIIDVDLGQVITSVPYKPHLISNKKGFLKQFIKNLNENIDYTKVLVDVLNTKHKQYANSPITLRCYLPLLKEYLEQPASYWKNNKISYEQKVFLTLDEYGHDTYVKSFVNMISWFKDKDINWHEKTPTGNSILGESIITSMQLSIAYINETIKLSSLDNTLVLAYKNATNESKKEVLSEIKNNWEKIWDSTTSVGHHMLHTPLKKQSNIFTFMHHCLDICINDGVILDKGFFDDKWNAIKEAFAKFQSEDETVRNFLILASTIELHSTLHISDKKAVSKPKKINKI